MQLKDESILAIGMISIALGILIGRFLHFEYSGFSITDFVEGVLVGLSLVMNLTYLIRIRKKGHLAVFGLVGWFGVKFYPTSFFRGSSSSRYFWLLIF